MLAMAPVYLCEHPIFAQVNDPLDEELAQADAGQR